MKRSFGRFLSNRRGAFAMQFALMVVPLFICTGLAIDGGRAFLARFELGSALDAAALAAGSTVGDQAALEKTAQTYVDKNYRQAAPGSVALTLTQGVDVLTLDGKVPMNTFFMPIVGVNTINVSASSEVRRGGTDLEVALVLDTTGSMKGQRLTDLKSAATDLVNTVVNDAQEPHYSRLALVTYGDNVYVGSHADAVRGTVTAGKAITGATWKNGSPATITNATWKSATTKAITGITKANPGVITSNSHGLSTGDLIGIKGVSGMTQINDKAYQVVKINSNTFSLKTLSGSVVNTNSGSYSTYSSGGTWWKCANANCEVGVTAANTFTNGDTVIVQNVGGMTGINSLTTPWVVGNRTSSFFTLTSSVGPAQSDYTSSSGTAQKCFTSTCEVKVTSANHGFSNGDYVAFDGVGGMTAINWSTSSANSWLVKLATTNDFVLTSTTGPTYSDWTSAGNLYCTNFKCKYYRYQNLSSTYVTRPVSQCVTERSGDDAYTDTDPATSPVGWNYPGYSSGTNAGCRSTGAFIPLNSGAAADVRKTLTDAIAGLGTNDSTAGEVGLAWGWYMLSPNFGSLWTGTGEVSPKAYGSENLAKVLVMMTDGEFNTANYHGVNANDYSAASNSDRINHASDNGDPWAQADALCAAAKKKNITIYTVGFGTDLDGTDATHLQNCATVPGNAYLAATGDDLKKAFAQIAKSIALLRLSK